MLRSLGCFRLGLGTHRSISILGSRGFRAAPALVTAALHILIARFGGSAAFALAPLLFWVISCFPGRFVSRHAFLEGRLLENDSQMQAN